MHTPERIKRLAVQKQIFFRIGNCLILGKTRQADTYK
jgi:hypothetical protein